MSADPRSPSTECEAVQARLADAFLAHASATPADLGHARGCAACGPMQASLLLLGGALDAKPAPVPSELLVQRTQRRVRAELAALREREQEEALASPAGAAGVLPDGFGRECGRLLLGAVAVLPVVLLWNGLVLSFARRALAGIVPETLLALVGGAYVACFAAWLTFLYGSIPFVAHRRARRPASEVMR